MTRERTKVELVLTVLVLLSIVRQLFLGSYHNAFLGILTLLLLMVPHLIGRSGSVGCMSLFAGTLPDGYDKKNFVKLLTWGGLRGGLSVALAMSTSPMLPDTTYHIILGGTYAIVFFTTIIQGLSMKNVYAGIERQLKV